MFHPQLSICVCSRIVHLVAYNSVRMDLAPSSMAPIHIEHLRMVSHRTQNIADDESRAHFQGNLAYCKRNTFYFLPRNEEYRLHCEFSTNNILNVLPLLEESNLSWTNVHNVNFSTLLFLLTQRLSNFGFDKKHHRRTLVNMMMAHSIRSNLVVILRRRELRRSKADINYRHIHVSV